MKDLNKKSNELRECLTREAKVEMQKKYYVLLPRIKAHEGFHPIDSGVGFAQRIHPKLKKINELVTEGETDAHEIKKDLRRYVSHVLCPDIVGQPDESNRAYFPTLVDI